MRLVIAVVLFGLRCLGVGATTAFLYLTHTDNPTQRQRFSDLHANIPNVKVVWGGKQSPWANDSVTPTKLSATTRWSGYRCCVIEHSIMWAIEHVDEFDYVWFMENDVAPTNAAAFGEWINKFENVSSDLVHQNVGMETHPEELPKSWRSGQYPWQSQVADPKLTTVAARFTAPIYTGYYHLYRFSKYMVRALDEWYLLNDARWIFNEPLVGTLALQKGLSTSHLQDVPGCELHLRWRPCFTDADVRALSGNAVVHPYKFSDACGSYGAWQDNAVEDARPSAFEAACILGGDLLN
jgi:hypothetical protein